MATADDPPLAVRQPDLRPRAHRAPVRLPVSNRDLRAEGEARVRLLRHARPGRRRAGCARRSRLRSARRAPGRQRRPRRAGGSASSGGAGGRVRARRACRLPRRDTERRRGVRRAAAAALAAGGLLLAGCGHGSSSPPTVSTASDTGSTSTLSIPPPLTGGSRGAPAWLRFGVDAARRGVFRGPARITVRTVGSARPQPIELPGTVDSSPIYLRGAEIGGARHDVFVVTTTYGRTIALDADSGRPLWVFTPAGFEGWAGSSQITTSTPLASPDRRFVYSVSPDGRIHALRLADGRELETGGWPVSVTLDPTHEKIAPAL